MIVALVNPSYELKGLIKLYAAYPYLAENTIRVSDMSGKGINKQKVACCRSQKAERGRNGWGDEGEEIPSMTKVAAAIMIHLITSLKTYSIYSCRRLASSSQSPQTENNGNT
jgi:hypothetical protein